MYGINSDGGFVLLTGEVGTGKSTGLPMSYGTRCLRTVGDSFFILNPKLSSLELLAAICDEFRIPYPKGTETIRGLVAADSMIFSSRYTEDEPEGHSYSRGGPNLTVEVLQSEQLRSLHQSRDDQAQIAPDYRCLGQPELMNCSQSPSCVNCLKELRPDTISVLWQKKKSLST